MPDQLYLVMTCQPWEFKASADMPLPSTVTVEPPPDCIGYAPIFATREAAEREFPESKIIEIETKDAPSGC